MAAAAAAPQLAARYRDDFNPGLAQQRVGVHVAVVSHDHAGRDSQQVVAVVPLLAFGFVGVATGGDAAQRLQSQRLGDYFKKGFGFRGNVQAAFALARPDAVYPHRVDHFREHGDQVYIAKSEHGVQVHGTTRFGNLRGQHPGGGAACKKRARQLADGLR